MEFALAPTRWLGLDELRPTLRSFLRRRCRDGSELEDILQETLLRAARYRETLSDPRRLRGWTQRIATNVLRDRQRRARRDRRFQGGDEMLDAVEGREEIPGELDDGVQLHVGSVLVDRRVVLARLTEVFGELREADLAVLRSYYGGEQCCTRTGRECSIPAALVKVRLFRARQRVLRALRRRLDVLTESERDWPSALDAQVAGPA